MCDITRNILSCREEQFLYRPIKRHQEIVDHYQKITESYKNSLESII